MVRNGFARSATVAVTGVVLAAVGATTAVAQPAGDKAATGGNAAAADPAAVRAALERTVTAGAPGAFAEIRDHVGPKQSFAVGKADLDGTPMNANWRFRVGSNTKMFTSVLVLRLAERGRIDLDKPLRDYLPAGTLPAGWDMTGRQVMQHRSGIFDHTNDLLEQQGEETTKAFEERIRNTVYKPADMVAMSVKHGQQFTPGSKYAYSNTNYVLLGMAIEHLTGGSYAKALRKQIIEPLKLKKTSYVVPSKAITGKHVTGYLTNDDRTKPLLDSTEQNGSWVGSAGAVISSAADLDRFLTKLLKGRSGGLLSDASVKEMTTALPTPTAKVSYGLGLRAIELSCGTVYGHGGIVQGFQTQSFATRDGKKTAVVFGNASNNTSVTQGLTNTLEPAFCSTEPPAASRRSADHGADRNAPAAPAVPVTDDTRV
ncbi:serine hydrolase domain-containing protein [Streptomyces alboflavus]|uniref:serine hydrolase domain-containing protein n=1 Tax=Streptomyces alboflavus TaxID=67267 RepID=UPI0007C4CC83|nr:serine hydrolase domain-containing protein [Streptomyces alboflavus]